MKLIYAYRSVYCMVHTLECTFIEGSDKVVMVIVMVASNNKTKQKALIQLVKLFTSNNLTIVSQHDATNATVTAAYQPSI